MHFSKELLKKLEALTRIRMEENQTALTLSKLEKIFSDFSLLQNAPVQHLEPLFHFSESLPLREDDPIKPLERSQLLANAPASTEVYYRIPSFLGEGTP